MLTREKIASTTSALFLPLDALYAQSFPWHEQREMPAKQLALS
ncbi:GNAT family N-acetyltransferase, partial [Escherichia coli]|nr:GNAT family N-acetyltransferase [Escherichia coli]